MTNKDHIEQEIVKTLQCLDGINRAEANPFLFTRIMARMEMQSSWDKVISFVTRPAVAMGTLFLIIAINAFFLFNSGNSTDPVSGDSMAVSDVSEEYSIAATTNYDYENIDNE